uniref:Small ribosomal subunit protein uS3c n=1 Tax=Halimeda micronesica TaxID=170426 RepID=A0A386AXC4_9CHLO|nr:ribosomal protein S3 [Halimeda micronesica]
MGQKVHPLGFRLGITQLHLSQWYASKKYYSKYVLEDHFLRTILQKQYAKAGFEKIEISRKIENHLEIVIHAQKPAVLIGKKGPPEGLQNVIKKLIFKYRGRSLSKNSFDKNNYEADLKRLKVVLYVMKSKTNASASSIADFIISNLEKRVPYKIVFVLLKKNLKFNDQDQKPLGMKVQISGRLNGAEIARQEWIREGRLPLHTLQAKIDYSFKKAYTIYGILGVKVWLFKNLCYNQNVQNLEKCIEDV